MRASFARHGGSLVLVLLVALAPTALKPRTAAAEVIPALSILPTGLLRDRSAASLNELPLGWATFLGGRGDDTAHGIARDSAGNIYVTGETTSTDFPVTPGAAQPHYGGGQADAFVESYDVQGRLRWSTYLGGSRADGGYGITVDAQGDVFVTGYTDSAKFPVTPGEAQTRASSSFLASYTQRGQLRWSTYLAGPSDTQTAAIAVDRLGNVYVTGFTNDYTYSIDTTSVLTPGAAQPHYGGGNSDAFVASYDGRGRLRWDTYLGGESNDEGYAIATDAMGSVYVVGRTSSPDFPTTRGVAQTRYGTRALENTFVTAYDDQGHVRWSTYLGGSGDDEGNGILVGGGALYVAGGTDSTDFPITPGAAQSSYAGGGGSGMFFTGDVFVARLIVPGPRPPALDPASPPSPGTPNARFFSATRHTLADPFLAFWDRLGGIRTLGLPLSEPFALGGQQVQVTERAVLVLAGGQVRLLPLGRLLSAARTFTPVAPVANTPYRLYFPSTGHTLSGQFLSYWQAHQGTTLLGPPISESEREGLGDGTGRVYLVQWFTNGRLELHPEIKDAHFQVEQGRVGFEYLHRAGLLGG